MLQSSAMQEPSSASPFRFGAPVQQGRGVTAAEVERTADALLRAGERPTVEKIRAQLGGGSPNTITPLLDAWWKRLTARLDAGPAALHRLPEVVAHVAEALWLQALEAARERVGQERKKDTSALDERERRIEVQSYVLTLREAELEERVRESKKTIEALTRQVKELTTAVAKERVAAPNSKNTRRARARPTASPPKPVRRSRAGKTGGPPGRKARRAKKRPSRTR
jgi:hypothetical protein